MRRVPWAVGRGVWLLPIACRYDKCWSRLGNLMPHCACWRRVECLPLACCCKNVFREKGVRVDTVAISLFLASIWNLLARGGKRVIGWQRPRKHDLLPLRKMTPIGYSCYVAPGALQLLCLGHPASPWHSRKRHELT